MKTDNASAGLAPASGSVRIKPCPRCERSAEPVDICERCGREFGNSGQDANGWNCTCVHCGNNTYDTQCPCCGASRIEEEDIYSPNTEAREPEPSVHDRRTGKQSGSL